MTTTTTNIPVPAQPSNADYLTFQWAHNPAAWIGIALCIFLLLLWLDRNTIHLNTRKSWKEDE